MTQVMLEINNPESHEKHVTMLVDAASVANIIMWYGAFYAGDDYTVTLDGVRQKLDHNGELWAERDELQSELDDYRASDWPSWAKQIYSTLKEFGYRYDDFDGIDLPEDVSEFLRGFPENAASELMEQRDDALQELATLRASEAAAPERVKVLELALNGCIAAIEHADMADGVCCCGDNMEGHSEPMNCGHSPVDMGEYHAHQVLTAARAALTPTINGETT